ncbi:bestrophin family protein [Mucilaginibacter kameinonensis]|uniref:bestrophin family protein n=1 Tax=Mucilaginibacter kameinonensis TaxID=452286 RepID=UPI001ABEF1AD|nr:bestrophin family ion channel [Mucilaginibacter kameinonensis]
MENKAEICSMIIRKKEHWFRMLFIWHGSVLPRLLPRLGLLLVLSVIIVYLHGSLFSFKVPLNPAPFTLFGLALALFLGFRNSASYERFWEGRKLWGALLNDTRSLARQAFSTTGYQTADQEPQAFVKLLIALTYSLKHQLRGTDAKADLEQMLPAELALQIGQTKYKPIMLLSEMGSWVRTVKAEGKIDSIIQVSFEESFNKLSDIVGGCERIASTPIPYSYRVLLHRTVYLYCFMLPFGLVDSLGWLTPLIVVFIAYTFVAFEAIADEIEEPFGTEANDLALNAMCRMIETTLLEIAGQPLPDVKEAEQRIID